jgi:hypothetical protein
MGLTMAYEVIAKRPGAYRILLEQYSEGVYMYVFEASSSKHYDRDHLLDDFEMAMRLCEREYGVKPCEWTNVPDQHWHGAH